MTAAEMLRIEGFGSAPVGWRPPAFADRSQYLWGTEPFKVGLWVGGSVTPNRLLDTWGGIRPIPGALSILHGAREGSGEPAQVMDCPVCGSILSVPSQGLPAGSHILHWLVRFPGAERFSEPDLVGPYVKLSVVQAALYRSENVEYCTLSMRIETDERLRDIDVDIFWSAIQARLRTLYGVLENPLDCVRASRPGYFTRTYSARGHDIEYDFEIACPNPGCATHKPWVAGAPSGSICGTDAHCESPSGGSLGLPVMTDGNKYCYARRSFRKGSPYVSDRMIIPALTVDEQIYHHLPSVVVSTVDKFARPPFEPRSSALFGNVDHHHCVWGYYRHHGRSPSNSDVSGHPSPAGRAGRHNFVAVRGFAPPDLIMQDELHLIEGPLGSLVGFYETATEQLCSDSEGKSVKYIASTATVRKAEEQVRCVFNRSVSLFPPHGLDVDDRFFIRDEELHPLADKPAGRLYIGICAPGRGPLTPLVRLMARMLQTSGDYDGPRVDDYWTLSAYFNAVRELAGARALYRQDIPERLRQIADAPRELPEEGCQELSSRVDSTNLPGILDELQKPYPNGPDALFTTSMFGTGIDILRIGLMLVNGQPKTTASYIQATGRVGRRSGGLVVTRRCKSSVLIAGGTRARLFCSRACGIPARPYPGIPRMHQ